MDETHENTDEVHSLPPGFRLYSVGVWVAFPTISTEVKIYPFVMIAQTEYEAVARVFSLFLDSGYDPNAHVWGPSSTIPLPTEIFHIDAVPYPDSLLESALAEIAQMPDPEDEMGEVFQLFPKKPPDPSDKPPDDKPPKS